MRSQRSRSWCLAGTALLGLAVSSCRDDAPFDEAAVFPRKPIKVVVPFPAGGGSDSFVRIVQKAMRDEAPLPQPLVVINVPGAGGTVGSRRVRDAAPDGHTILCLHEGILSSKYAGRVPYGPEAFRPIAATGQSNLVICVRADSKFTSLTELIAATIRQPDAVRFGMAQGTPTHFAGRRLEAASEGGAARFRFVASGGGARRFNDLVGGHIDATPFSLAEYSNFKASGVRAIAYLGAERLPELPELSTAREQGIDVTMTHIQYWWAPKSTPDHAINRMADALEVAMSTGYVREKLNELQIHPLLLRGEALEEHLRTRDREFQDVALVHYQGVPNIVPFVLILVASLAALSMAMGKGESKGKGVGLPMNATWRPLVVTLGTLAAYVIAMQIAGLPYAFATMAFVPLIGIATGGRSPAAIGRLVGVGIALGSACFFVFTKVLVIDLP